MTIPARTNAECEQPAGPVAGGDEAYRQEILRRRKEIIQALEGERGSRVITLIHRREPWSAPGEKDHITIDDSEYVLSQVRRTPPDMPIDLIVHTPGGLALAAEMIAMALHSHNGRVTVMVPFYAMSGGTLVALAADEIRMERYSVLGPVDPQISGYPAASLVRLAASRGMHNLSENMAILAELSAMAVQGMRSFVEWLLEARLPEKARENLAEFLTGGYMNHGSPITLPFIRELGLPAKEGLPDLVYDLFATCRFGICRRPSLPCCDVHPSPEAHQRIIA